MEEALRGPRPDRPPRRRLGGDEYCAMLVRARPKRRAGAGKRIEQALVERNEATAKKTGR